jgi:hypothetical protein
MTVEVKSTLTDYQRQATTPTRYRKHFQDYNREETGRQPTAYAQRDLSTKKS